LTEEIAVPVSPNRPRVALVGYTFYPSDGRLNMYVDYLVSAGYDVDVVALEDPRTSPPRDQEHVRFFLPRRRFFERQGKLQYMTDYIRFTIAVAWLLLRRHFSAGRYSAVHVNNMPNFLIFGALPLRLLGVRILLDLHDTMPEIYRVRDRANRDDWLLRSLFLEERVCMKLADYVITSEHTKLDRLLENGLRPTKSNVILNLANPALFPEFPLREPGPAAADAPFRIVYHGTLTWRLGIDTVIRAIAIAREKIPGLRYEITGDGEQRGELVELVNELGLESVVTFSDGFVPVETLAERVRGADLAVLASRLNPATDLMLPVKLLEYIRMGIPCIAAPTKTICHYFTEDAVRFLRPDNPGALANAIVALAADPAARQRMARAARRFYDRYNYDSQRGVYTDIIRGLERGELPAPGGA
jgi:glycosyltransferase involved in cell wall biosynthesis